MYLFLRVNGQNATIDMEQAGKQTLTVGEQNYQPARLAQQVRKLATKMWGRDLTPDILSQRLVFEVLDSVRSGSRWGGDSGSFTPAHGASITLGRWDEQATVGIALHELAHEMHLRSGGYDNSDNIIREALALLAEREAKLVRSFEREPYYTASNLVDQLCELRAFDSMSFQRRWAELSVLDNGVGLSDLVNYYLDREYNLGLDRWIRRYSKQVEVREMLLTTMAACSLRYSLDYRRTLIRNLVRCPAETKLETLLHVIDAVATLDQRYPDDDLERIITFCFEPLVRNRRRLAFS
jgi:hypothetical protein